MKKYFLLLFFLFTIGGSYACDLCGCNSGNYFIGPFPQFNKNFVGLRYSFQQFNTVLSSDNTQFSKDFYQTAELMAGTKPTEKLQLLMFVPYRIFYTQSDDGSKNSNGLGDITFIGNYNLINSRNLSLDSALLSQQLWLGAGVKLPTGKFAVDSSEIISSANMQPGSGSFDFILNAMYNLQFESWGLNLNTNYIINQSAEDFRFGNRFNSSIYVFRSIPVGNVLVSPNLGLQYEGLDSNTFNNTKVADTGGYALLSAIGIEFRFKDITLGCNTQMPLIADISNGQTNPKLRGMCHISYIF